MPAPRTSAPRRPRSRRRTRRRSWIWRYRRLLLLAGILLTTAAAGFLYVLFKVPLPDAPSQELLNQTSFLTDASGQRLASFHYGTGNRTLVRLREVPLVVRQAVVDTEDRNFFRHSGVDPIGSARATWADIRNRSAVQGGSTITQQYVKNTYVGRERSIWRKLKEAVISVKLERKLSKDEILERYLNTIYWGRGAYGVQAASQAYFGRDVAQLGLQEASYLAGIIRSPQAADAAAAPRRAAERRHLTLAAMVRAKDITRAQQAAVETVPVQSYVLA